MSWQNIPGRSACGWIFREWIASKPRPGAVYVEVGVALGKSIARMCEMLDEAGRDDVQVYAVDPWAGTARNGEQTAEADVAGGDFTLYTRYMLENAPRAFERVRVIRSSSPAAVELFVDGVDLAFIDADHTYVAAYNDILAWSSYLNRNGWIAGDDHHEIEYPGVVRACKEIFGENNYVVGNEDGWPTWLHRSPLTVWG
jgi:hypothetical protein